MSQREHLYYGVFYGVLLCTMAIAFLFALLMREANAFNYGLFVASTLLFWLALNGYGFQYLWPDFPALHNQGFHLIYLVYTLAALHFSRVFLQLKHCAPSLNTAFSVFTTCRPGSHDNPFNGFLSAGINSRLWPARRTGDNHPRCQLYRLAARYDFRHLVPEFMDALRSLTVSQLNQRHHQFIALGHAAIDADPTGLYGGSNPVDDSDGSLVVSIAD